MFVVPFQAQAETTVPEGFYIVNGQSGTYYAIDELFNAATKQEILGLINDVGFDKVSIVLDGRIVRLDDFVFRRLQGVPVSVDTMPNVSFVDRFGNVISFPWDEWLEVVDVQ